MRLCDCVVYIPHVGRQAVSQAVSSPALRFYDEQTVVYPAGHNTIIHNLEQRTQKFLTGTEKSEEITAMCVSPNKKFVAVAEKVRDATFLDTAVYFDVYLA